MIPFLALAVSMAPLVSGHAYISPDAIARLKVVTNAPHAQIRVGDAPVGASGVYSLDLGARIGAESVSISDNDPTDSQGNLLSVTVPVEVIADGYELWVGPVTLLRGKTLPLSVTLVRDDELTGQLPPTKVNPKDGAELIRIPAGDFTMGNHDFPGEQFFTVRLSAYYIYKNCVTVAMYEKFCKDTGRPMPEAPGFNPGWIHKDHPIVNISWYEAQLYSQWAGAALPSEAQWAKAARGTDASPYPWGNTYDPAKLRAHRGSSDDPQGTGPVGSYPAGASPYGVLDMAGNVTQWCRDWYDENFWKAPASKTLNPWNHSVGDLKNHATRGSSWDQDETAARTDNRWFCEDRYETTGFRCIVTRR